MEDYNKKVGIIKIEFDKEDAQKSIDKLTESILAQNKVISKNQDEIISLTYANKDLQKQVNSGAITQEKANETLDLNSSKILDLEKKNYRLKDSVKTLNADRANALKTSKLEANSLDALRKRVADQKKELNGLNTAIEEEAKRFAELTLELKNNNDRIVKLDQAAGDYKTTIGRYREETSDLKKLIADQTKELNGLNTSTVEGAKRFEELTLELNKNNDRIVKLNEETEYYKATLRETTKKEMVEAVGGVKIFGNTLKDLWKALLANPIILIIGALTGLVSIFKETQAGAEFLRKTSAYLNGALSILKDIVEKVGNSLINAFSRPKETIENIGKSIKENIIYYLTEFIPNAINKTLDGFGLLGKAVKELFSGDFSAAMETAKEGAILLTDGVTDIIPAFAIVKTAAIAVAPVLSDLASKMIDTADSAALLQKQLIANEKATADQDVLVAKSIQSQKALNTIIEDQSKTYAERLEAAEEFNRVEKEQVEQSIKLASERVRILKAQNDLSNSTEEDLQRVRDAEINLANLQAASSERLVTNSNKLFSIKQQQAAEEEKLAQEAKEREEGLNARILALAELRRSKMNETRLKEAEGLKSYYDLLQEIENENFERDQDRLANEAEKIKENESLSHEEKLVSLQENQFELESLAQDHADRLNEIAKKQAADALEIDNWEKEGLKRAVKTGQQAVYASFDAANNLVEKRYRKRFSNLEKQFEAGAITEEQYAERKNELEKRQANEAYRIQKQQFLAHKAISLVEIIINTARGITNAIASFPPPASFALAAATGALGTAQSIAVAAEQPPPPPSFKEGGIVINGKDHSLGGEDIHVGGRLVGNMQGGEGLFVTKKEATISMLNDYNTKAGGRSMFENSGRLFEQGGKVNTNMVSEDMVKSMISEIMENQPPAVVEISSVIAGINAEVNAKRVGIL